MEVEPFEGPDEGTLKDVGMRVRQLVENLRAIIGQGPVERDTIEAMKKMVKLAVPRLQQTNLCLQELKPGRYLCYKDPDFHFVVMLLVWGQGDKTPIHDHGTWGVEAVLKSQFRVTQFNECEVDPKPIAETVCDCGTVMHNLPPDRDVHRLENCGDADCGLSLHIYGREMSGNRMFVPGEGFKSCALETRKLDADFAFGDVVLPSACAPFGGKRPVNV